MNRPFDSEAAIARMAEARPQIVELAEIVALAASVDRRLLRKARRTLTSAGPEAEADLYFSELVLDRNPARFVFRPEAAQALRRRLAARPAELERAWALVSARHDTLPATLRTEELLQWHALRGETDAVRDLLRSCVSTLVEHGRQGFAAWAIDAVARMDPLVREHEEYRMLGLGAAMRTGARPQQLAELADERLAEWLEWLAPDSGERTELGFTLVEGGIEFGPAGDPRYSQKISLPGRFPQMLDIREAGGKSHVLNLRSAAPTVLETASKDLVITAEDGTRLRVRPPGQRFINANRTPRVHISYDVETHGVRKSIELPFVIGVLGDFAGAGGKRPPLEERHFREIDADNFDRVMALIAPKVSIDAPNDISVYDALKWELRFNTIADFAPDAIVRMLPQTTELMQAREALNDLLIDMDGKDAAQAMVTAILTDRRTMGILANQVPMQLFVPHAPARREARKLRASGDIRAAISIMERVIVDRGNRLAFGDRLFLSDLMSNAGAQEEAHSILFQLRDELVNSHPDNPLLLTNVAGKLARSFMNLGDHHEAEAHFRLALRNISELGADAAAQERATLHFELATVLGRLGRHDDALAEMQKSVEFQEHATRNKIVPLPPQRSSHEFRFPAPETVLKVLDDEVIPLAFGSSKARILGSLADLCAILADEPQLNFGDPFKTIESVIDWLDALIAKQINHILADPGFQKLESTWRGLDYLVRQTETGKDLKIRIFDVADSELLEASQCHEPHSPDGVRGQLYRNIYEAEFGQLGGTPFTAILCDFAFGDGPDDLAILSQLGTIGAIARATFIASAAPSALGLWTWREVQDPRALAPDRLTLSGDNEATQAFRRADASRHIVLTMPGMFGRARYSNRDNPVEAFAFDETGPLPIISAGWALGVCIARACTTYGWPARIRGVESGGVVSGWPSAINAPFEEQSVTEVLIPDRREAELSTLGLLPLVGVKHGDEAVFIGSQTLHIPGDDLDPATRALAYRLHYELIHARFAHYMMCLSRDWFAGSREGPQLQADFQEWLSQYVGEPDADDEALRARYPLQHGGVYVEPDVDTPGYYVARLDIIPTFQLDGMPAITSRTFHLPKGW